MDKSPLDKDTLLKSILSKGREIIKVKNAHKREKEMSKTNSLQKKLNKPIQDKIEKRLKSRLKPKTNKFEKAESEKVKSIKRLSSKTRRNAQGFKIREPKHNNIDRDMRSQRALERSLQSFSR